MENRSLFSSIHSQQFTRVFIKKATKFQSLLCLQGPAPESTSIQAFDQKVTSSSQFFPTSLRLLWTETHRNTPPRKHTHQHPVLFQQGTKIAFKFIITQVLYALNPHIHLSPRATVGEPLRSADVSALPTG